jgi:hypothetical protein
MTPILFRCDASLSIGTASNACPDLLSQSTLSVSAALKRSLRRDQLQPGKRLPVARGVVRQQQAAFDQGSPRPCPPQTAT